MLWGEQMIVIQQTRKIKFYLISGTGNAWAWHKSAKLSPACCTNAEIFEVVENVGAFEPTGSMEQNMFDDVAYEAWLLTYRLPKCWDLENCAIYVKITLSTVLEMPVPDRAVQTNCLCAVETSNSLPHLRMWALLHQPVLREIKTTRILSARFEEMWIWVSCPNVSPWVLRVYISQSITLSVALETLVPDTTEQSWRPALWQTTKFWFHLKMLALWSRQVLLMRQIIILSKWI